MLIFPLVLRCSRWLPVVWFTWLQLKLIKLMAGTQSKICLSYPISHSTTPGVRPADDIRMTYVIRQWNLTRTLTLVSSACHLHVIRRSSACRPQVVCTRLQLPKYFQLNSRTALLKIKILLSLEFGGILSKNPNKTRTQTSTKLWRRGNPWVEWKNLCFAVPMHKNLKSWEEKPS